MHRIDNATAINNLFTDGDAQQGVPATVLPSDWLNDLQEEVCHVVEQASLTLDKDDHTQLEAAISGLITAAINALGLGSAATRDVGTSAANVLLKSSADTLYAKITRQWQDVTGTRSLNLGSLFHNPHSYEMKFHIRVQGLGATNINVTMTPNGATGLLGPFASYTIANNGYYDLEFTLPGGWYFYFNNDLSQSAVSLVHWYELY